MSDQQLATRENKVPVPMSGKGVQFTSMDELARFCQAVASSGLAPKGFSTPQQIMVAVQSGLEIGLAPMQSLQAMAVINGRSTLWGDAALALVTSHPDCRDVKEEFDEKAMTATCTVERANRSPVTRTFSQQDAKAAGLWGKAGPWTQYPKRMLQMRARAFALRDSFPDALKGVGIREEVSDFDARTIQGRVIEKPKLVLPDPEDATEPAADFATQEEEQDETGFKF